ncbi:gliding motility lipoprotein GldD [Psychroflexus sediminis]|uniref:Protein involved in gliding motility GldD n=1 Tax=Psychroflexus sediminis TaxID=470826 RepID=A0A1G7Z8J2_9FLAO|nr:gliding motility lipoprotein GldD [Psychroflexus sediminis]SDH05028.1 protein involved in gliding motility GldD [Psychroflexus sediminis]
MNKVLLFFVWISLIACSESTQPKPSGFLALDYEEANYSKVDLECPFTFEKNEVSTVEYQNPNQPCWINLNYPRMKAKIYLTYSPVEENLRALLIDAQKLPEKHTIKADQIEVSVYQNQEKQSFGNFYEVEGDAASQALFYMTDSTSHFLTGSVYFEVQPNYDSILPAASYIKKDLRHLVETLEWR